MDISLEKCYVGVFLNSDCFKQHFTTSLDLIVLIDLPAESQRVIKLRVKNENLKTICAHHYAMYFDYYDTPRFHFSKNCCDPFKKHKRAVRGIHKIILQFSDKVLSFKDGLRLIPGKTLCPRCFTQLSVSSRDPQTPRQYEYPHKNEGYEAYSSPFVIRKVITSYYYLITYSLVIAALSRADIITPIADLNKSNKERSRICTSTLEVSSAESSSRAHLGKYPYVI
jgi:hypothetical protein